MIWKVIKLSKLDVSYKQKSKLPRYFPHVTFRIKPDFLFQSYQHKPDQNKILLATEINQISNMMAWFVRSFINLKVDKKPLLVWIRHELKYSVKVITFLVGLLGQTNICLTQWIIDWAQLEQNKAVYNPHHPYQYSIVRAPLSAYWPGSRRHLKEFRLCSVCRRRVDLNTWYCVKQNWPTSSPPWEPHHHHHLHLNRSGKVTPTWPGPH